MIGSTASSIAPKTTSPPYCAASARIVAELGGAAPLAAIIDGRYVPAPGGRVGVVIGGANTTAVDFGRARPRAVN
jgi:hypothetical protein